MPRIGLRTLVTLHCIRQMDALPTGTQTSMTVFRPEVNGQKPGAVKAFLMADNPDDLRCEWRPCECECQYDD